MSDTLFILKELWSGKSLSRATLNKRLLKERLTGNILDLGSGGKDLYSTFIPRDQASSYQLFDQKKGQEIDFETDQLPYSENSLDHVLLLNVLEHLYDSRNILKEIERILRVEGSLIGYVPFLMWYHPDPHDYFRYTHETLERMLRKAGFTDINVEPIYRGPYSAAFQMIHPTVPVFLKPLLYVPCMGSDTLFTWLRPTAGKRYALGYYFTAKRNKKV